MLIHHPHDLAGVHCGTAAQRNDAVWLEGSHRLGALFGAGEGRVGSNVIEAGVLDAHLVQLLLDRFDIAVLIQEGVGDDEAFLLAHHSAQLIQCNRHAALLHIYLLRRSKPQHILSPLSDGLDVQQMFYPNVFGNRVSAPGTAAQSERRGELEVVQVADAAVGGWGVDDDAAGLHGVGVLHNLFLLGRMDVQRSGVAVAAVLHQLLRFDECLIKILGAVHRQHWGELLVRKLLGEVHRFHLADQDLGACRDLNPRHLGDGAGTLADNPGVESAVNHDGVADLVQLVALEEIAAAVLEFLFDRVVDVADNGDRLLGGADHAVIEGFGVNDRIDSELDIGAVVDDDRGVSRADAQRRFAGGVSRLDHAGAAGGQDGVRLLHDLVGQLQAWRIDPADDIFRRARRYRCLIDHLRRRDGGSLCTRVGTDDDGVAGL